MVIPPKVVIPDAPIPEDTKLVCITSERPSAILSLLSSLVFALRELLEKYFSLDVELDSHQLIYSEKILFKIFKFGNLPF